jgi:hypothetical protein
MANRAGDAQALEGPQARIIGYHRAHLVLQGLYILYSSIPVYLHLLRIKSTSYSVLVRPKKLELKPCISGPVCGRSRNPARSLESLSLLRLSSPQTKREVEKNIFLMRGRGY